MKIAGWLADHFSIQDHWALITGASAGIGLEYFKLLSNLRVNCLVVSDQEHDLQRLAREMADTYGNKVIPLGCDLADIGQVLQLAEQLAEYEIKILINNAGYRLKGPFTDSSLEDYMRLISCNALAPMTLTHRLLPAMAESEHGIVIHVGSIHGLSPLAKAAVYSATKSFVLQMALGVAHEYQDTELVFQVCLPGSTLGLDESVGSKASKMVLKPDEVAAGSLNRLQLPVYIPNPVDRVLSYLIPALGPKIQMDVTSLMKRVRSGFQKTRQDQPNHT